MAESLSKVWDALNDEIAEIVMTLAPEREVHPAIESRPRNLSNDSRLPSCKRTLYTFFILEQQRTRELARQCSAHAVDDVLHGERRKQNAEQA